MIRNSYKVFSSSKFPKFQVVKFNPNGYNSAMRLNLFSNTNAKRDALYNSIILPTFDNKFSYSNFTYKYFNLKWKKFEQKANYNKYVKTPATFPNFLVTNNYFTNAFLKRRRKRRVYKRRRIRYSVIFKNRFLRSTKSTFRAYRLHPFYPAEKVRKLRKKLLRTLARKKSFKRLVSKYWVRRHWPGYYRRIRQIHGYKYYKRHKKLQRIRRRFYFKRRSYKLRVFRFFKYKRISKKLRYARRYAYRSIRRFKRLYRRKLKFKKFKNFKNNYLKKQSFSKIFKFQFFKRLARRAIKRRYFFLYLRKKLKYRIRARIFLNKFGIFRFLGFRDHLLQNYFNYTLRYPTQKSKKPGLFRLQHLPLFGYLFSYPQKILYSKNAFYFKLFTVYNILKTNKLTRFRNHFNLNVKQYRNFYTLFRDFFSIISVFKFNFIPFRFKLFKKNYFPTFVARISAFQYIQRRKLVRNLRFCTYFALFARIIQLKRGTRFYRRMIKKFIKFIYRRVRSGSMLLFLPFVLNKFLYFGLISHFNTNIYFRDPIKFNNFYSTRVRKSKFLFKNKI